MSGRWLHKLITIGAFAIMTGLTAARAEGNSSGPYYADAYMKKDVRLVIGAHQYRRYFSLLNLGSEPQEVTIYFGSDFESGSKDQSINKGYALLPRSYTGFIPLTSIKGGAKFVSAWELGLYADAISQHDYLPLDEDKGGPDRDAQPYLRIPPSYPERCMRKAEPSETVHLRFDVSATGVVENITVIETTNECLNEAALKSVEQWIYSPKLIDGEFQRRTGVETVITFKLEGYP